MPTGAVHALEHLLAGFIREEVDDVIDYHQWAVGPRLYLIKVGESNEEELKALFASLQKF